MNDLESKHEDNQNHIVPEAKTDGIVIRGETISFRYLTLNDVTALNKYLNEIPEGKEFLIRVIHHQIKTPEFTIENFNSWLDEELLNIANYYVYSTAEKAQNEIVVIGDFFDFRKFIENRIGEWTTIFKQLTKNSQAGVNAMNENAFRFIKSVSPIIDSQKTILQSLQSSSNFYTSITESVNQVTKSLTANVVSSVTQVNANKLNETLREMNSFAANLAQTVLKVEGVINQFTWLQTPTVNFASIFAGLSAFAPALRSIERYQRDLETSQEAFKESGYEYAMWFLRETFVLEFARLAPSTRKAQVTKRIFKKTQSEEFEIELKDVFLSSTILNRRWKIVRQGIAAHRARSFATSIPVFLAQAEGLFTDILIMNNLAFRKKSKLYAKNPAGVPKLDKNGKKVSIDTLNSKVTHAKPELASDEILHLVVDLFLERLIKQRNDILHGRICGYDTTKLANQTLLLVHVLANEIVSLEK